MINSIASVSQEFNNLILASQEGARGGAKLAKGEYSTCSRLEISTSLQLVLGTDVNFSRVSPQDSQHG